MTSRFTPVGRFTSVPLAILCAFLAAAVCADARARQQSSPELSPAPSVENSKFQAIGEVNANAVYVRSGPSENDYPVMKLDKGAHVTVVGARFDWLKIVPPEGSFCYVAKAYVEKHGDGSSGRVTNTLNVRVGSTLNAMKTKLAMKLEAGSSVEILGEQDEYFKIKPPQEVYVYVNRQFVDAVKVLAANEAPGASPSAPQPPSTQPGEGAVAESESSSSGQGWDTPAGASSGMTSGATPGSAATPSANADNSTSPSTQPATPAIAEAAVAPQTAPPTTAPNANSTPATAAGTAAPAVAAAPTTAPTSQPAYADNETDFERLEIAYGDMLKMPLDEQDIPSMIGSYQLMSNSTNLPESLRRVAEAKVRFLGIREKDRQEYLAFKKEQDAIRARQQALRAEREEIEQRLREREVKYYTAVGTLRPSSIQQGTTTLYRLTDPGTGRTVVYIRTSDNKIGALLGEFIGVRGDVTNDGQLGLRVISPTMFESVDQSKLYTNVASQIVPPSLMAGGTSGAREGTATTGNE